MVRLILAKKVTSASAFTLWPTVLGKVNNSNKNKIKVKEANDNGIKHKVNPKPKSIGFAVNKPN